jgi:hypothetical protein
VSSNLLKTVVEKKSSQTLSLFLSVKRAKGRRVNEVLGEAGLKYTEVVIQAGVHHLKAEPVGLIILHGSMVNM